MEMRDLWGQTEDILVMSPAGCLLPPMTTAALPSLRDSNERDTAAVSTVVLRDSPCLRDWTTKTAINKSPCPRLWYRDTSRK